MNADLVNAIRALSHSSDIKKSGVGQIRELLPEIESAQNAGVRLTDIAAALREQGIADMDLKCLQNYLYQARKARTHKTKEMCQSVKFDNSRSVDIIKSNKGGIDADSILQSARTSMQSSSTSNLTLNLLRTPQNNLINERK
jgi:hypothetical protein